MLKLLLLLVAAYAGFDLIRTLRTGRARTRITMVARKHQPARYWRYVYSGFAVLFFLWPPSYGQLCGPIHSGGASGQRRDRSGMDYKGLRALLVVHGFITMAAGIVLTVAPGLIPSAVGIRLDPSAHVVAYLLAGAEFGFAVLSFGGSRLTDSHALRLVVWSCIALHGSSGVLEVYAYAQGASVAIFGNVAARAVVVGLFAHLSSGPVIE